LGSSVNRAHPPHAIKVFWKGLRETFFSKKVFPSRGELFSKSSPPIKELGTLSFFFSEKKKNSPRD
jgi:hypothetical protein